MGWPALAPDGSPGSPSYSFASTPGAGMGVGSGGNGLILSSKDPGGSTELLLGTLGALVTFGPVGGADSLAFEVGGPVIPESNPYDRLKVYDYSGANPRKVWSAGNLPIASGSWSPSVLFTGGVTIIGYDSRVGHWLRVGNLVFVHIAVSTTTVSGASGDVRISAPPFAGMSGVAQLLTIRTANIPIGSGHVPYAYVRAGETAISVAVMRSNTSTLTIKADDWGNNGGVIITGVYLTGNP